MVSLVRLEPQASPLEAIVRGSKGLFTNSHSEQESSRKRKKEPAHKNVTSIEMNARH